MQKQLFLDIKSLNYDFSTNNKIIYDKFVQKDRKELFLHKHNCYEFGICLKGTGTFFVNEKIFPFVKGDVTFIPPNVPHIATSPDDMPSEWIFFFIYENKLDIHPYDIPIIIQSTSCCQLMKMLYSELEKQDDNYDTAINEILSLLVIKINRYINKSDINLNTDSVLSPAFQYISKNYNEQISISYLASLCYLSKTHFRRLFKHETSMPPLKYITKIRLEVASGLLITGNLPIIDVSLKSGFYSLSSFNRYFKEYYNMSPSEYRKNKKHS